MTTNPTVSQSDKAEVFEGLHKEAGAFVIANAWDIGSARLLAGMGAKALATTSSGLARTMGRRDYQLDQAMVIEHCRAVANAVSVPLSADLENGFGDAPETCAETIRLGAEAGLVGGSIEDATTNPDDPIYEIGAAKERVQAAVEAARAQPFKFMLTARAENYLHGRPDFADTLARLQAFQDAGADVLFAPGLQTWDEVRTVCSEVDLPVNIVMGPFKEPASVEQMAELGVKRVSVGGSLTSAAMTGVIAAAKRLIEAGDMTWARELESSKRIDELIEKGAG